MSWVPIAIATGVAATAVVGLFAWAVARSAAIGDQDHLEQRDFARALEADKRALDRRSGPEDPRAATRPWSKSTPASPAEAGRRQDLAHAEDSLKDAEARLAETEGRRSP